MKPPKFLCVPIIVLALAACGRSPKGPSISLPRGASVLERFAASELRRYLYLRTGELSALEEVGSFDVVRAGVLLGNVFSFARRFGYHLPVPDGTYRVTLKLIEYEIDRKGGRVFDVLIRGKRVAEKVDIYAEVGRFKPYDLTPQAGEAVQGVGAGSNRCSCGPSLAACMKPNFRG
jgi:hypothetical protein